MNKLAEEILKRTKEDEAVDELTEFLEPEQFVAFIRRLAWDHEAFTRWLGEVLIEAADQKGRFDT